MASEMNSTSTGPDKKDSPESPEMEMESPESPEEQILFVEDRRPGSVTLFKSTMNTAGKPEFIQEDFTVLSSADDGPVIDHTSAALNTFNNSNKLSTQDAEKPEDLCFVIEDRNPLLKGQQTSSPRYKINENFLKLQSDKKPSKKFKKFSNPCFNCGDCSHALRDCPEPRNHMEINKNRREYMQSKPEMPVYKRYHVDEQQQYAHLTPGTISPALRNAMGLQDNELPSFIYHMRRLGYPPGWLQEAIVPHSGISMFDGQGKEVAETGTVKGDVKEDVTKDKYDNNKIVHFPGFNVPPPPGTHDDCAYYRCPPMSKAQHVDQMLKKLGSRVVGGYKRRKQRHSGNQDESVPSSSQEMEYEELSESIELPEDNCKFLPPLPDSELPPPPPLDLPEPTESSETETSLLSTSIEDTSLIELEERKKSILAVLNDVSPLCGTPDSKIGKTKSMDLGTPILKNVSPYARLPSAEKFSVNICDVINFENLPDSTGKYDKIRDCLKTVRSKLSEFNNDH